MPKSFGWRSRMRPTKRPPQAPRQYVTVRFTPYSHSTPIYHLEGARAEKGDRVIVETSRGSAVCDVVSVSDERPAGYTRACRLVPRHLRPQASEASDA